MINGDQILIHNYTEIVQGKTINVPMLIVQVYLIEQDNGEWKWEIVFPCESVSRIEKAIGKEFPNYFKQT